MLNKHFQRQVSSLHVLCRNENRGCGWKGELAAFHQHVESCPMRDDGSSNIKLVNIVFYAYIVDLSIFT